MNARLHGRQRGPAIGCAQPHTLCALSLAAWSAKDTLCVLQRSTDVQRSTIKMSCRCLADVLPRSPVAIELQGAGPTVQVHCSPCQDGRYSCTYTPAAPGFYRLKITCAGQAIRGSPYSVQVDLHCTHLSGPVSIKSGRDGLYTALSQPFSELPAAVHACHMTSSLSLCTCNC